MSQQSENTNQTGIEVPKPSSRTNAVSAKKLALGILVGIPAAVGAIVIVGVAMFAAGQKQSSTVPLAAAVAPQPSTLPSVPEATNTQPLEDPAVARAAQFMETARRLSVLRGDALTRELWAFEQTAESVTYAMLKRNPDRFRTRHAIFSGRVLEIQDTPDGGSFIRIGMGEYGENVLAVMAAVQPSESIVERSRVRVYGILSGSYTYQSQAGWTITIPSILAVSVVPSSTPRRPGDDS